MCLFIHSCFLHLLKFNSHWPSLHLKSGLCPGAPRWMPWRTSHSGVLFASGFAAVSQIVSITRRWLWTLTSACQRPLCIHIVLAPQRKGHSQAPLCEGLLFITKKSNFSPILMRGSWGQSRLLVPFEWDYPCILSSAIKGSKTRWNLWNSDSPLFAEH